LRVRRTGIRGGFHRVRARKAKKPKTGKDDEQGDEEDEEDERGQELKCEATSFGPPNNI
jgi:hypothetical protein